MGKYLSHREAFYLIVDLKEECKMMRDTHLTATSTAGLVVICCLFMLQSTFAGSIVGWGFVKPPDGSDFIAIAAGLSHGLALRSDGSIIGWGAGKSGQTGWPNFGQADPPEGNNFVAIAAGYYHNLALKSDGSIVCWGANWYPFFQSVPPKVIVL